MDQAGLHPDWTGLGSFLDRRRSMGGVFHKATWPEACNCPTQGVTGGSCTSPGKAHRNCLRSHLSVVCCLRLCCRRRLLRRHGYWWCLHCQSYQCAVELFSVNCFLQSHRWPRFTILQLAVATSVLVRPTKTSAPDDSTVFHNTCCHHSVCHRLVGDLLPYAAVKHETLWLLQRHSFSRLFDVTVRSAPLLAHPRM